MGNKVFDCFAKDFSLLGKKVLEASAGTGKTFAIEQIAVRLLIEEAFSLEQILIVTFTRAAARELKMRVRKNIEKAFVICKKKMDQKPLLPEEEWEYLSSLDEKGPGALHKTLRTLREALLLFHRAQIFTLHGFCYRMLFEHAFESATLRHLFEEEGEDKALESTKEELRIFLSEKMKMPSFSPSQAFIVLNHYDFDLLAEKIFGKVAKGNITSFPSWQELWKAFHQKLLSWECKESEEEILAKWEALIPLYKKSPSLSEEKLLRQLKLLISVVKNKKCTEEEFDFLVEEQLSLFSFLKEENRKKKSKELFSEVFFEFSHSSFFSWLQRELYPLILEASDPKKILERIAKELSFTLKNRWEEEGIFAPDFLLQKVKSLLEEEKWKKAIQGRYRALLIDEFQDTDPVQWEIFSKLFFKSKDLQAFYLVGDPKQSIYRFRFADVYTYLEAVEKIGKEAVFHLDTNFRSSPPLVEALNLLFSHKALSWMHFPKIQKSLPYLPVKAGKKEKEEETTPIHFFVIEGEALSQKWPSLALEEEKLFPFIAKEIAKLQGRGASLSSCAVFIQDRYQARRLQKFLSLKNIPSSTKVSGSLLRPFVAKALKEFFLSLFSPFDEKKLKVALGGPYVGWNAFLLEEHTFSLYKEKALQRMQKLHDSWKKGGLSLFLYEFLFSSWGIKNSEMSFPHRQERALSWEEGKRIEERLVSRENLDLYQETMALFSFLLEKEERCRLLPEEVLSLLRLGEKKENLPLLFPEGEGVQLLTLYGAKGLEFDFVFALSLASRTPSREEDLFEEEKVEEKDAEKQRKLYVAMTRAKKKLFLSLLIDRKNRKVSPGNHSPLELFIEPILEGNSWTKENLQKSFSFLEKRGLASFSFVEEPLAFSECREEKSSLLPPIPFYWPWPHGFRHSFSSLSKANVLRKAPPIEKEEQEEKFSVEESFFPRGKEVGHLLHFLLEKIFQKGLFSRKDLWENFLQMELKGTLLEKKTKEVAVLFQGVFSTPLLDGKEAFCLQEVPWENFQPEAEFLYALTNNSSSQKDHLKGFVDLLFFFRGKYYLLDWKSNDLGSAPGAYSLPSLQEEMKKHDYFLQASLYTEGLYRFLKVVDKRPFEECFGGMFYLFLRGLAKGEGIFHFFPKKFVPEKAILFLQINGLK